MAVLAEAEPINNRGDYVDLKRRTGERHELVEGVAYAVIGASAARKPFAMNIAAALPAHRGACDVFQQTMKPRVETATAETFLYLDVMLCCAPTDNAPLGRERPSLVADVSSPSTERGDFGEKFSRCQSIATLEEYLVVQSTAAEAEISRRQDGWGGRQVDLETGALLKTAPIAVDFTPLYDRVNF